MKNKKKLAKMSKFHQEVLDEIDLQWKASNELWDETLYQMDASYRDEMNTQMMANREASPLLQAFLDDNFEFEPHQILIEKFLQCEDFHSDFVLEIPEIFVEEIEA